MKKKEKLSSLFFFGTSKTSVKVLQSILELKTNFSVIGIICPKNKNYGRGLKENFCPLKIFSLNQNIPIYENPTEEKLLSLIKKTKVDFIITCDYGKLIKKTILDAVFCLNIHFSLLPKLRGPAPIEYAILNNLKETGISVIRMTEKIDAGDIYYQDKIKIDELETGKSLLKKLIKLVKNFCFFYLIKIIKQKKVIIKQDEKEATYTKKIRKNDRLIDWKLSSLKIKNKINAFYNRFPAYTYINNIYLQICKANTFENINKNIPVNKSDPKIGKIILFTKKGIVISCGSGNLLIISLKFANENEKFAGNYFYTKTKIFQKKEVFFGK